MKLVAVITFVLVMVAVGSAEAQQSGAAVVRMTQVAQSELVRNYAQAMQSALTPLALIVGGIWAFRKFVLRQEQYPHIETSADINFIGKHKDHWVIELIAWVENKGTAQHKMTEFDFDLYHLLPHFSLEENEQIGGQVPHLTKKGSFLPRGHRLFFVDPSVKAKYSYITKVPAGASMLILHWWFKYADGRGYGHAAEITKLVPKKEVEEWVLHRPDAVDYPA